jgi:hypothetical protein
MARATTAWPIIPSVSAADFSHVIGHRFPGGTTTVPGWMNDLWGDAILASDDPAPYVHPVLAYYAAVQGSGVTFQDVFDVMDASSDSGIMVGEQQLEFNAPLLVDAEYRVEGEITSVARKTGRRAGTFDIASFELRLIDPASDALVATSTTSFVFPRAAPGSSR